MDVTTSLFDGVTKSEYAAMLNCFKASLKTYRKGEEVPVPAGRVGLVQRGAVGLIRTEVARSWAYMIARTHQIRNGSSGSRNTS